MELLHKRNVITLMASVLFKVKGSVQVFCKKNVQISILPFL